MSSYRSRELQFHGTEPLPPPSDEGERIDHRVILLGDGPAAIRLADKDIYILVPQRDLRVDCDPEECWVVDPSTFDLEKGIGHTNLNEGQEIFLGRGVKSDQFRYSPRVSRVHAKLERGEGEECNQVTVIDWWTPNGTFFVTQLGNDSGAQNETGPASPNHS